jgi:hypothetical protein
MDLSATNRFLAENGEDIILRRLTGRGFRIDVACRARVIDYTPEEQNGVGIVQGDQKAILSNDEIVAAKWPGPPRPGDVILRAGGTITALVRAASSYTIDSVVVRHNLQVRGA